MCVTFPALDIQQGLHLFLVHAHLGERLIHRVHLLIKRLLEILLLGSHFIIQIVFIHFNLKQI